MLISPHTYVSTLTEIMVDGVGLVRAACSNQVEKDDKFCTSCRLKFSKFCWKCGERKVNCSCDNKIGGNAPTPTKTLQDLIQQKGKDKIYFAFTDTTNPPPDGASLNQHSKYKKCERKTVNITVGLMKLDDRGCLKTRASTADLTVVKQLALEKHSNLGQYFYILEDYVLLYSD